MKAQMMSKAAMDHLFDHIIDGHRSSHEGIEKLEQYGLATDQEVRDLLKKNNVRLIERIKEFKIMHKLTCIAFAYLFGYFQISGEDLEMRRSRRVRTRRKQEYENVISL